MSTSTRLVRLRPRSGKKNAARFPLRYTINGIRFEAERGWYRLTDLAFAAKLKALRLHEEDPDSPRIFDVCTEEEALALQAKEKRSQTRRDVEDADAISAKDVAPVKGRRARAVTAADATGKADPEPEEGGGDDEDLADGEPAMIDPDPDGEDLAEGGDDQEGVEAVGKLDDEPEEPKPKPAKEKPAKEKAAPKPRRARATE
jgi:hypothetical protein